MGPHLFLWKLTQEPNGNDGSYDPSGQASPRQSFDQSVTAANFHFMDVEGNGRDFFGVFFHIDFLSFLNRLLEENYLSGTKTVPRFGQVLWFIICFNHVGQEL